MRVSEFYKLGRSQPSLKFIDVDIDRDVKLFVNARAVRLLESEWGDDCSHLLASFFLQSSGLSETVIMPRR